MAWPNSNDYCEAIQTPQVNFSDPELKAGEVVCGNLGTPQAFAGNFADVYQVRSANGSKSWAVKCFTRRVAGLERAHHDLQAARVALHEEALEVLSKLLLQALERLEDRQGRQRVGHGRPRLREEAEERPHPEQEQRERQAEGGQGDLDRQAHDGAPLLPPPGGGR